MKNILDMTIAELVAEYNDSTGKAIKKFRDRATAEKQVKALRAKALLASPPKPKKYSYPTQNLDAKPVRVEDPQKIMEELLTKKREQSERRSIGVAKTWLNPTVKQDRVTRANVEVDGVLYSSVREAFQDLGLPMHKHIAFRIELKKIGRLRCSFGERTMMFRAIPVERQMAS